MNIKDTYSIAGGASAGLGTGIQAIVKDPTIWGTPVEFWHLILYSFIGGCVGWIAKELLESFSIIIKRQFKK
jgi:hypothetical protein